MSSDGRILDEIVKEPLRGAIRRQLIDVPVARSAPSEWDHVPPYERPAR